MEKGQRKANILPWTKSINLMEIFPKILNLPKESFKITPSEYIKEMSLTTEERHKKLIYMTNVMKAADNDHPADFRIVPRILMFQRFEPMTTIHLTLEVKNVGKTLLPVKMDCPESVYFSMSFVNAPVTKLAPGLSVEYDITFTPKEGTDYYHHLVFRSREHTFQVPIIGIGPRPVMDIPDHIILNPSPVKISTSKFVVVRNIGNAPAVFSFITEGKHFQVHPSKGILGVRDSMMLTVMFESYRVKEVTESLYMTLETGEKFLITLHGSAENVSVRLEKNSLVHEDTYIGLKRLKTVRLINCSSNVVKFTWKKNKTREEDLKFMESLKDKYKELSEMEILRDEKVIYHGLSTAEKHKLSCERILSDEVRLLEKEEFKFSHETFRIMPESGEVWPKGCIEIMISFEPKARGLTTAEAYLEVSGREARLPLRMKGNGLGPNIVLNVKTLDIDYIYLCSLHRYEITAENKGDIPGTIEFKMEPVIFGGKVEIFPERRYLKVGELGVFIISFKSNRPGEFIEQLTFEIKESKENISLVFKGRVVSPTLHFDINQIDFGVVPWGVCVKREVNLNNLSVVPVTFSLRVIPDGDFPSLSREKFAKFTIKPTVPKQPKEFEVDPEESVVEPFSSKKVTVMLTANRAGSYQKQLMVDLWDSDDGTSYCPIRYKAEIATLEADPESLVIPFCFINYPYTKVITLKNTSTVPGFFYIVPPDPNTETSITFSVSVHQGIIEPGDLVRIDLTLITNALGRQSFSVNMLTFGYEDPREMCMISCIGQGPVVSVHPMNLNWGDVPLLSTVHKGLEFVNESPIPASLALFLVKHPSGSLRK